MRASAQDKMSSPLRINFIWFGVALAVGYWLLEAVLPAFVFTPEFSLLETMEASSSGNELYMRLIISALLIAFGFMAERLLSREHQGRLREKKLNQLLHFLSDVNRNVQRQTDQQALLDAACQSAVKMGGFRLAWIGLPQDGGLRMAAWAVGDSSLEDTIRQMQQPLILRCCLGARRVFDEGKFALCAMKEEADCHAPWLHSALGQGCAHAIALPLKLDEKTIGVFEVYAGDDGHLGEDERAILEEVAGDISSALANIEHAKQRREAEEALHSSEMHRASILERAHDAIISMDEQGRITGFNPAAERMFGHAQDDVLGHDLGEKIIPPSLRKQHGKGLKHYLATGEGPVIDACIEVIGMHADGHEFPVEVAINSLKTSESTSFSAIVRDISERKKIMENLKQRLDELERFQAATVAREFRIKELRDEVAALKKTDPTIGGGA